MQEVECYGFMGECFRSHFTSKSMKKFKVIQVELYFAQNFLMNTIFVL